MTKNIKFNNIDLIFYTDGYQLAQSVFLDGFTTEKLFIALESLYAAIDGLNESLVALANRQNNGVVCFKGCHWCCHQAVFASLYELNYLSEKVKEKFTLEELNGLIARTGAKYAKTSNLNEAEILNYKTPCPLLINDSCSAYAFRPMACRIYLSTRLETCLEFYSRPENEKNYPALIDFPLKAGRMMNEGFGAVLKENGIETTEFRLEEGLQIAWRKL